MSICQDSVISRSEVILHCELDDQMVLMNIDTGEYFEFDPVASTIWEKIETPQAVSAVCAKLLQEFSVEQAQCQQEVLEFLAELMELGVIELNKP